MAAALKDRCPSKIDIGPVYNVDPQRRAAYQGARRRRCCWWWWWWWWWWRRHIGVVCHQPALPLWAAGDVEAGLHTAVAPLQPSRQPAHVRLPTRPACHRHGPGVLPGGARARV